MVADAGESRVVGWIQELHQLGWSQTAIANHLHNRGAIDRRGTPWRREYVARILKSAV